MFKVIYREVEVNFDTLDEAMSYAKTLGQFVTIKSDTFELVGKFGVDSIKDGVCPDGVKYDWVKRRTVYETHN